MSLSMLPARISLDLKLPMADCLNLATARQYQATIFTQDADFADIEGVKYFK